MTNQRKPRALSDEPWAGLAPGVAAALRPGIPQLSDEIIDAIRHGVPTYARPLEGAFGAGVRVGVEQALIQFVDLVEKPDRDRSAGREVYVRIGRGEARAGRTMEALLAAYRLGARVAWRRVAEVARSAELGEEILARLAESIFAYIDELSAASAAGHAQEQAAAAGEAQRRRRRLATLMIQSPPPDPAAVEDAARDAGWPLPGSACRARLGTVGKAHRRPPAGRDDRRPGRRRQLRARPRPGSTGSPTGDRSGPGRTPGRSRSGGPVAAGGGQCPARLRGTPADGGGVLPASGLVLADEHLAALILHADRGRLHDLAQQRLAPLAGETENSRERLSETLLAWLDHQGKVPEIAAALHVHPQTVRYRLGRLRECFGSALDDPEHRFELALVLRARSRA